MYSRFNCCYFYFQNNCINIIQTANPRQTKVFNDKGSLNQAQDIAVNTIAPIAKIGFRGDDYILPDIKTRTFSNRISLYMNDLKCGRIEDTFNWLLKV